ncbi:site-2 protease family protein [bacterium]|nr:site-2 protease family protein [bacterium]
MPLFRRKKKRNHLRELDLFKVVSGQLVLELVPELTTLQSYFEGNMIHLRGSLIGEPEVAVETIIKKCRARGYNAFVSEEPEYVHIKIARARKPKQSRIRVNIIFGVLTLLTVLWAGGMHAGVDILEQPGLWYVGLPFAGALLLILLAHELGHYFTARHYGIKATLPLFLPVPNPLIGTFGAVIKMKSPIPHRKALFDVGLSGPLAGLAVAIGVILIGLNLSEVITAGYPELTLNYGAPGAITILGESFLVNLPPLYKLLQLLVIGPLAADQVLMLHPVAFAGWLGLLVTALNLIPMGQLDGGHVIFASLRRAYKPLGTILFFGLLVLAWFWQGWLLWAALLFIFSKRRPAPLNDLTPLTGVRRFGGYFTLLVFFLCFTPVPIP